MCGIANWIHSFRVRSCLSACTLSQDAYLSALTPGNVHWCNRLGARSWNASLRSVLVCRTATAFGATLSLQRRGTKSRCIIVCYPEGSNHLRSRFLTKLRLRFQLSFAIPFVTRGCSSFVWRFPLSRNLIVDGAGLSCVVPWLRFYPPKFSGAFLKPTFFRVFPMDCWCGNESGWMQSFVAI
jgi:hypothetical protein